MATFDFKPVRNGGVNFIMVSDDRRSGAATELNRREVEQIVRNLCRVAGLPEPWKQG